MRSGIAERRHWGIPIALCFIVIGFYWKLTLTSQYTWLAQPDSSAMVLPWMQFQAREWHHSRFPLWDPTAWAGQPLLAQGQPGAAYPLNWLLFLVPMKHGVIQQTAVHWYYVVVRMLAALMFYLLCRDLGRSRGASLVAGAVYGIGGYLGSIDWPQMVNGAVWVPLVLMFQFRAARGDRPVRNSILSGFFLGVIWLCGHHQLPMFVSLGYALLWVYLIFRGGVKPDWMFVRYAAIAIGVAVLVSGLQTIPMAEYGRLAQRWVGADHPLGWNEQVPYALHTANSFKPIGLLGIVLPGFDSPVNPLIGAIAFALAIVGVWRAWSDERVRWLAVIAVCAVIFALGTNGIFHGFLYSVLPGLDKARVPAQALILFHAGAVALLAFGLDSFPKLPRAGALAGVLSLLACGVLLCIGGAALVLTKVVTPGGADARFMITALASLAGAGLLWGWWKGAIGPNVAIAALLGFILLELGTSSGYNFAHVSQKDRMEPLQKMSEDTDIRDYLTRQPGPLRIEYEEDAIPHNVGDWWGIDTFTTYVASAPDIVMRNEPWNPRVQAMLGITYYFGTKPPRTDLQEVFTGASGRKLYRYPVAFPRAWAVHQVAQVKEQDTPRVLTDPSVDLRTRAVTTQAAPALESCDDDRVEVPRHLPGLVVMNAEMRCRGMVVLSDTYFPGWHATVDGKSAPIYTADGFVRGVVVDGGKHTIEMRYRPASVILGALMTLVGSIIAMGAWLRAPRSPGLGSPA